METFKPGSHPASPAQDRKNFPAWPVITQTENNTTLWIGHLQADPTDHFGGQTFTCPADGQLDNIQLYAAAVQYPGDVELTLHEFDPATRTWGAVISAATLPVEKQDREQWIRFILPALMLKKEASYGFRVQTSNALVGLGEAARDNQHPFTFGHEWSADSKDRTGHYYSYFSLAFKVELRA